MIVAALSFALLPQAAPPTAQQRAIAGMQLARTWMLGNQEENGAWGHWRKPEPSAGFWWNPETHYSFQVATTGLGCLAMMDLADYGRAGGQADTEALQALERGLDFLIENADVRRPSDWDTDHTWALTYGSIALAHAGGHWYLQTEEQSQRLAAAQATAEKLIARLWKYQTASGGWAYYADESMAARPHWATSFQTAAVVIGLLDARKLGWKVDEDRLQRALAAIRHCRLPNGAYSYSVNLIPSPGGLTNIDQVKGSLSRIQVCNLALQQAALVGLEDESLVVDTAELEQGLRYFFRDHRFLDIAAGRPIPHEAWYYNSGYFYFFGHYYAAGVINQLPPELQAEFAPRLWHHTLKFQAEDGSLLDFKMNSQGRPYATAYALSALARTIPVVAAKPAQD